jgi:UDP-glucose 4-epimerase
MYLVTGGAGFIGSHIVQRLVAMGDRVRILDNFSTGKPENLRGLEDSVEVIFGDLLDQAIVRRAVEGVEIVFHHAAPPSVPFSVENPALVSQINVEGTVNVLIAARDAGAGRVVYASSSSVYGNGMMLPMSEQQMPSPISPDAVSKLAGEYYCRVFTELYGLESVSLRYFNVYGPRQDPNSQYAAVIPRFIHWALQEEPREVHGKGLQSRDFTYIDDAVNASLLAAHCRDATGQVINVGQGKAYCLLDLIDLLREILGFELRFLQTSKMPGDTRHSLADISLAEVSLGYRPEVSLEEGMLRTVEYFRWQTGMHSAAPLRSLSQLR